MLTADFRTPQLIFVVGGTLSKDYPAVVKLVMGVCFGGALTFVVFAGSELFTGSNLVLTVGVLSGKASGRDLAANWVWTWVGNLLGAALLAVLVIRSGVLAADPASRTRVAGPDHRHAVRRNQMISVSSV